MPSRSIPSLSTMLKFLIYKQLLSTTSVFFCPFSKDVKKYLLIDWSILELPGGSNGKESTCNVGHLNSIPVLGRSPGEGNSYPLQCSGLENSMNRGAWQATVHGVPKCQTFTSLHFLPELCLTSRVTSKESKILSNLKV